MKVVILAGGLGTRLSEETTVRPKPMVEIGGQPILWHIMKIYAAHGVREMIVCCGYKGEVIKDYFANYVLRSSDVTFDLASGKMTVHDRRAEDWSVTLVDTGLSTLTGGRIKRVKDHLNPDEPFCLTYGDGVSDVNVRELIAFHRASGTLCTLTAVKPPGRFGAITLHADDNRITTFQEKPEGDGSWINGGFFVVHPKAIDCIEGDETTWEREPLQNLAKEGQLSAYRHPGFWQPMDTLRDKALLQGLWDSGQAPWKVWP
ncbi:MAG: glucose-1-phosphate cytidylyltransferase [Myxococcales bacterium]|nr:glucose-1-phosphate cytidylyltransferase [Myxococcales bacterium]